MTGISRYRGERLGFPASGPGSISPFGPRAAAFIIDLVFGAVVAAVLVNITPLNGPEGAENLPGQWSGAVVFIEYVVGILIAGRTVGMNVIGLRIVRANHPDLAVNPLQALIRTALLFLVIPAVIWDRDGRGFHDRLSDTAVIRS